MAEISALHECRYLIAENNAKNPLRIKNNRINKMENFLPVRLIFVFALNRSVSIFTQFFNFILRTFLDSQIFR